MSLCILLFQPEIPSSSLFSSPIFILSVLSLNVLSSGSPPPQSQMDQVILSIASVASTSSSWMSPFPSIIHAMIFVFWMLSFRQESLGSFKESWAPKNWCFWTVVLEKMSSARRSNYKEIQPVYPKGNQSWLFIGRTDAEAETPILWLPDTKSWLIWKDPDAGKDWRREKKGTTENEMVGWYLWLNGHEFE